MPRLMSATSPSHRFAEPRSTARTYAWLRLSATVTGNPRSDGDPARDDGARTDCGPDAETPPGGGQPVRHALQPGPRPRGRPVDRGGVEARAVVGHAELQVPVPARQGDGRRARPGVLGGVLQRLEHAEGHGCLA